MPDFSRYALAMPDILLPGPNVDLVKWAVVACDQYTAQPEYWMSVQALVGDAPSTLHMIYPEAWLKQGDGRIAAIHSAMDALLDTALTRAVRDFVLVERSTESGARLGLMAAIDLEAYD
ncbi:MAG: DUF1015 domain-containing protein, partial [Clostridiales bacterium]|nr:DUF1015 domain-containing protein [Clostridiales bacterium]